jgi:hypothetical protein
LCNKLKKIENGIARQINSDANSAALHLHRLFATLSVKKKEKENPVFESITFAKQNNLDSGGPLDLGTLVECMIFYQNTNVIADHGILTQVLEKFGIEKTIELIEEGFLTLKFTESNLGVFSTTVDGVRLHDPVIFSSPQHTKYETLNRICTNITGKTGRGRRTAKRLAELIKVISHDKLVTDGARSSFLNQDYLKLAVDSVIKSLVPEVGHCNDLKFETQKLEKGIRVDTNIDFLKLNQLYHRRVSPKHSTITPAHILSDILNAEFQLYISSNNLTELATSSLSSNLIELKVNYLLSRSKKSKEHLTEFQDFIFSDAKSVREAFNSNRIDIADVTEVLRKSYKFKQWLAKVGHDENLLREYYTEVTKKTILDKLPGKAARWSLFTGLGLAADFLGAGGVGTVAGVAIGALDTFFVDKIAAGWKPNHFIENEILNKIK